MKLVGRRALLALAPLALALQSCEIGPSEPYARELRELEKNRRKWERAGLSDYRYVVRNTCFCTPEHAGPVEVEVRGGNPVHARYVSSGAPAQPQPFASMDSVEDLFDTISRSLDREPEKASVTYDATLGYPVSAHFDYDLRTADEEGGFQVAGFQRL
jgi:hypothetical protein